jgi:hypothetical protein
MQTGNPTAAAYRIDLVNFDLPVIFLDKLGRADGFYIALAHLDSTSPVDSSARFEMVITASNRAAEPRPPAPRLRGKGSFSVCQGSLSQALMPQV